MLEFKEDDLKGDEIIALLERHMDFMRAESPPESVHALDLDALRSSDIQFWSAWQHGKLMGCVALAFVEEGHAEIKSMHVSSEARGKGLSKILCQYVIDQASAQGYSRLSLETGSTAGFAPALGLYKSMGFMPCEPFGSYKEDPFSRFMTMQL